MPRGVEDPAERPDHDHERAYPAGPWTQRRVELRWTFQRGDRRPPQVNAVEQRHQLPTVTGECGVDLDGVDTRRQPALRRRVISGPAYCPAINGECRRDIGPRDDLKDVRIARPEK